MLHAQRLEANVSPLERYRPRIEVRPRLALDEPHLDVVEEPIVSADAVSLDAFDDETRGFVHPDRPVVMTYDAESDPV